MFLTVQKCKKKRGLPTPGRGVSKVSCFIVVFVCAQTTVNLCSKRVLETFFDLPISVFFHKVIQKIFDAAGDSGQIVTKKLMNNSLSWQVTKLIGMVDPHYTKREDFMPYLEHMSSLDLRMFFRMVGEANEHDRFPLLPEITVPVLVVAAENDKFTPVWLSERMAKELPRGELLMLANGTHAALIEHPDTINHRIERFLSETLD